MRIEAGWTTPSSYRILALLICSVLSNPAAAQRVAVRVVDGSGDIPLERAIVTFYRNDSSRISAGFTGDSGILVLRNLAKGAAFVVARHIGYAPLREALTSDSSVTVTLRLSKIPTMLTAVVTESEAMCSELGSRAGIVEIWENIRTALEGSRLTQERELVRMDVERYAEDLDPQLRRPAVRHVTRRETRTSLPFAAASSADLAESGYVANDADSVIYFAPDAQTLLSDEFAGTHCFFVRRGDSTAVGLSFVPKHFVVKPDVSGTLWTDVNTGLLTHLDFEYVNLIATIPVRGAGGRLEFAQLPNGAWVVSHWYIRAPRFGRFERLVRPYYVHQMVDTLLGFRESGGSARPLGMDERVAFVDSIVSSRAVAQKAVSASIGCESAGAHDGVTLYGSIDDGRGSLLRNAVLTIKWNNFFIRQAGGKTVNTSARAQTIDIEPASDGSYRVCGLPTGVEFVLHVTDGSLSSERVIAAIPVANVVRVDFHATNPQPLADGSYTLNGLVRDDATPSQAIPDAEIRIENLHTRSDTAGRFSISGIPEGTHAVVLRRVGFFELRTTLHFGEDPELKKIFVLGHTAPLLDTIQVRGTRTLPFFEEFEDRRRHGLGSYLTRQQFEREEYRRTSDILRSIPGVQIVTMMSGEAAVAGARNRARLGGGTGGGDASDRLRGAGGACYVQVFVDGVRTFAPIPGAPLFNINQISPTAIEGVEFYRGPAETPTQYATSEAKCGTLLVWTRRGDASK